MTEDPTTTIVDPNQPSVSGTSPGLDKSDEENQSAPTSAKSLNSNNGNYFAARQSSLGVADPRRPLTNGYASMRRTLTQPQPTAPQAMYRKEVLVPPVLDDPVSYSSPFGSDTFGRL